MTRLLQVFSVAVCFDNPGRVSPGSVAKCPNLLEAKACPNRALFAHDATHIRWLCCVREFIETLREVRTVL